MQLAVPPARSGRAHALAGRPGVLGRGSFGNFEQWDKLVASAIVYVGGHDPVKLLEKIRVADPEREAWPTCWACWRVSAPSLGTTGGLVAVAPAAQTGGAAPVDIALYFPGLPEATERLLKLEVARGFTLPTDLAGSRGHADTAATAEAVCTILQNGAAVGSITFAAASQAAAFALASGLALVPSDRLELVAPAAQDATLAGLALTLIGTRS